MIDSPTVAPPPAVGRLHDFRALARLSLTEQDLNALESQGCLALEHRGDRSYYKLRFRRGGRQVVRYAGQEAALVAEELKTLQAARRLQRELNKLNLAARQALREGKLILEPLLVERGFRFHGLAIRRTRRPAQTIYAKTLE
jgi:hypothetical protein